jgi:hypothetical protein
MSFSLPWRRQHQRFGKQATSTALNHQRFGKQATSTAVRCCLLLQELLQAAVQLFQVSELSQSQVDR